jgi:hypothetical protein
MVSEMAETIKDIFDSGTDSSGTALYEPCAVRPERTLRSIGSNTRVGAFKYGQNGLYNMRIDQLLPDWGVHCRIDHSLMSLMAGSWTEGGHTYIARSDRRNLPYCLDESVENFSVLMVCPRRCISCHAQ